MKRQKLLFHICCAPCGGLLAQKLSADFEVAVYFDNPNIWPQEEFFKRAQEAEKYFKSQGVEFILAEPDHEAWKRLTIGLETEPEQGRRCKLCYHYRLQAAAEYAARKKFDFFTTSLSISPYKNAEALRNLGLALGKKYGVQFLAEDFRSHNGFSQAMAFAKEQNFYRQKYCGCEFSIKNGKI